MHKCTGYLLLVVFFFTLPTPLFSKELDEQAIRYKVQGYKYYNGRKVPVDYAKALKYYLLAANRGDAEAQFIAGGMLFKGMGTDPDPVRSFKYLLQAAEQGKTTPESMQILGSMYLRGTGVPQSYDQAKRWLVPASEAGNLKAINDLAFIFYHGLDGKRQLKRALELYTKAAMLGDNMAQANLGMMYSAGIGTETDLAQGYAWYSLSASQGNRMALIQRNNLLAAMSWEELNQAQELSVDLYQKIMQVEHSGNK